MIDTAITAFFDERKAAWLKKTLKPAMTEAEINEKKVECEQLFSLENWLPNAAKRAGQISISTHPCTFSHPSARKNKNGYVSAIIAKAEQANDGYLRTGNVSVTADALGNAAALDVHKFLTLMMADGVNLLSHIEQDSSVAESLLTIKSTDYQTLKQGFLAMTEADSEVTTSAKIKQVYFPVTAPGLASDHVKRDDQADYHQLSLLTASPIVFELRKRIDNLRFSEQAKSARDSKKKQTFHAAGFSELAHITTIGYGGTKPQNISVLNNQNAGKAHLLLSAPPSIRKRDIHFPNDNFFVQSISPYQVNIKAHLQALQQLFTQRDNNMHIRAARDQHYQEIINQIIETMWQVRAVEGEQYHQKSNHLVSHQKTWLCQQFEQERLAQDDWLQKVCKDMEDFMINSYEKLFKSKRLIFGKAERTYVANQIENNKDDLR